MNPTIQYSGKGKPMETKKDQCFPGVREKGGMNKQSTEEF